MKWGVVVAAPSTINNLYSSIACSIPHDSAQDDSANREMEDGKNESSVGSLNLWFYEERHNAELELSVPRIRVHSWFSRSSLVFVLP